MKKVFLAVIAVAGIANNFVDIQNVVNYLGVADMVVDAAIVTNFLAAKKEDKNVKELLKDVLLDELFI